MHGDSYADGNWEEVVVVEQWENPGKQDMSFTPFVTRVLPAYVHCTNSIRVLFINSNTVLPSLHLDFRNVVF